MSAPWVSLQYNIYKNFLKLATFKISIPQVAKMAKINADEYFLCMGYVKLLTSAWHTKSYLILSLEQILYTSLYFIHYL